MGLTATDGKGIMGGLELDASARRCITSWVVAPMAARWEKQEEDRNGYGVGSTCQ